MIKAVFTHCPLSNTSQRRYRSQGFGDKWQSLVGQVFDSASCLIATARSKGLDMSRCFFALPLGRPGCAQCNLPHIDNLIYVDIRPLPHCVNLTQKNAGSVWRLPGSCKSRPSSHARHYCLSFLTLDPAHSDQSSPEIPDLIILA